MLASVKNSTGGTAGHLSCQQRTYVEGHVLLPLPSGPHPALLGKLADSILILAQWRLTGRHVCRDKYYFLLFAGLKAEAHLGFVSINRKDIKK